MKPIVRLVPKTEETTETRWAPVPELARALENTARYLRVRALGSPEAGRRSAELAELTASGADLTRALEQLRDHLAGLVRPPRALLAELHDGLAAQRVFLAAGVECGACGLRFHPTPHTSRCPNCGAARIRSE